MKTPHTPGRWVFAYGAVYREDTFHDESSIRLLLADRDEAHTTPTERDANCQLAAAAPDLLEAARIGLACCLAWGGKCEANGETILAAESVRQADVIRLALLKAEVQS